MLVKTLHFSRVGLYERMSIAMRIVRVYVCLCANTPTPEPPPLDPAPTPMVCGRWFVRVSLMQTSILVGLKWSGGQNFQNLILIQNITIAKLHSFPDI